MHYNSAFGLLLSVGLILNCTNSNLATRYSSKSNANGNVFNLLLGLYKLNPLKGSQVYKAFKDNLLLSRGEKSHNVLNFESDESVKQQVKIKLNEIEKTIHTKTTKSPKNFVKPEYDIDDVSTENFKVDIVLNDKILSKEEFKRTFQENREDFSSILEHIGSSEIDNDIPVTKLLPVNDTIIQNSQVNHNEAMYEFIDRKVKSGNQIGTIVGVLNEIPDEGSMNEKLDRLADVIVL